MGGRFSAFVRAVRTFVQGAIAAAFLAGAESLHSGLTGGEFNARYLVMGVITAAVGAVMTYVFNTVAPRNETAPAAVEGLVAFVRTAVQTLAAVGLIAAWDAVYALMTSGTFVVGDLWKAALAAGGTAVVAALHNMFDARNIRKTRLAP